VTDRDVRRWAELYLRTTGFDTIRVTRDGDVPVLTREGTRPHRFTVAALAGSGVSGTRLVDLDDDPVALPDYAGAPVVPNSGDEAYAEVHLDDLSWRAAVDDLASLPDPLLRAVTWSNAFTRVQSGTAATRELMDVVARHLGAENDAVVFDGVLGRVTRRVVPQWTAPQDLAGAQASIASVCATALAAGDRDRGLAAMRGLASTTDDVDLLQRWLAEGEARPGLELDRDSRWIVVRRLVVLGAADDSLVDVEAKADISASGHEASLTARASRPAADAKESAWRQVVDPTVSNRDFEALIAGMWTPGQEELNAPYLARYLEDGPRIAARGQAFAQEVAFAMPVFPMALPRLEAFRSDLATAAEGIDNTVLLRGWNDRVDDLDLALRVRRAR
jgi:aminopeptidase N